MLQHYRMHFKRTFCWALTDSGTKKSFHSTAKYTMLRTVSIAFFGFFLFLTAPSFSFTDQEDTVKEVALTDIILTTSEKELIMFAVLENGYNNEMIQGLHSGIPIHFSFFVELIQVEKNWLDKELVSMEFKHILTYDTLKEIYRVELEEATKKNSTYKTLAKAQKTVNEINNLKVFKLDQLKPNQSYQLRIKAELFKKTLPLNLHYIVPFISWWDIKTDWHIIDFKY